MAPRRTEQSETTQRADGSSRQQRLTASSSSSSLRGLRRTPSMSSNSLTSLLFPERATPGAKQYDGDERMGSDSLRTALCSAAYNEASSHIPKNHNRPSSARPPYPSPSTGEDHSESNDSSFSSTASSSSIHTLQIIDDVLDIIGDDTDFAFGVSPSRPSRKNSGNELHRDSFRQCHCQEQ